MSFVPQEMINQIFDCLLEQSNPEVSGFDLEITPRRMSELVIFALGSSESESRNPCGKHDLYCHPNVVKIRISIQPSSNPYFAAICSLNSLSILNCQNGSCDQKSQNERLPRRKRRRNGCKSRKIRTRIARYSDLRGSATLTKHFRSVKSPETFGNSSTGLSVVYENSHFARTSSTPSAIPAVLCHPTSFTHTSSSRTNPPRIRFPVPRSSSVFCC